MFETVISRTNEGGGRAATGIGLTSYGPQGKESLRVRIGTDVSDRMRWTGGDKIEIVVDREERLMGFKRSHGRNTCTLSKRGRAAGCLQISLSSLAPDVAEIVRSICPQDYQDKDILWLGEVAAVSMNGAHE